MSEPVLPGIDELRCFIALSEALSFRSAASAVHLSPSPFTVRIQNLEQKLGAELFNRTTRQVSLTPAGKRLLPMARKILHLAAQCSPIAKGASSGRQR